MELLTLTLCEIFFNPNDLNLILTQEKDQDGEGPNITYGFIITRGRGGWFKKLVEVKPYLPSLEDALEALFTYLENIIDTIQIPDALPGKVLTKHVFGSTRTLLKTRRIACTWMAQSYAA